MPYATLQQSGWNATGAVWLSLCTQPSHSVPRKMQQPSAYKSQRTLCPLTYNSLLGMPMHRNSTVPCMQYERQPLHISLSQLEDCFQGHLLSRTCGSVQV